MDVPLKSKERFTEGERKMLKIEKIVLPSPEQWEIVVEGMRNPMNSWDKIDSVICGLLDDAPDFVLGENDYKLMMSLNKGGTEHSKYRRMIPVWVTINAPLYWWKEADTYTVGKVQNSCSTMHKIHTKEFTLDDFSHEHLLPEAVNVLRDVIESMNECRDAFVNYERYKNEGVFKCEFDRKEAWWHMIQLLPTSYNQKRTVFLNYEVLAKMYRERKNHKLDEWHTF
jgi:hypothetical protein